MPPVPAAPLIVALLLTAAPVAGTLIMALAPAPLATSAAALFSAGFVVVTLVAVAGILLARGRWARHLGILVAGTWIVIGTIIDTEWGLVVIGIAAVGLAATLGPWLGRWLRRLPTAAGAPPAAVIVLLTLLLTPSAMALAAPDGIAAAVWGFSAWSCLLALALARIMAGSLTAARLLHPAAGVATAIAVGMPAVVPALGSAAVVAVLCWRRDVALAIAPIVPSPPEVLRLPPELAPRSVLEAAGADESGRRDPR
jgi:hypothetical protein